MTTVSAHELESAAADTWYIQSQDVVYNNANAGTGTITAHADDQAFCMKFVDCAMRTDKGSKIEVCPLQGQKS